MKILKWLLRIVFVMFFVFLLVNAFGNIYALITPKFDIKGANSFYLYDSKDNIIAQGINDDKWIPLKDMGDKVVKATISVEDKNFYKHNGFDYLRIAKSLLLNTVNGEIVAGASTITQQYAKNLFLNFDQTWERKWQEMWLAYELEAHYSKDEILEGYLNTINYGNGMYGIGNASKYYFNKDVSDLSLAEASILVGIPNNPSNYNPVYDFDTSKERQAIVLYRMLKNEYITENELNSAKDEELVIIGKDSEDYLSSLLYFKDAVMDELKMIDAIPNSYLDTGGLKVYTTLNMISQSALENNLKSTLINEKLEVAKVMMNPNDGSIIGLIGGSNYSKTQYNRATSALRQPGSTIKPFLYYEALANGFTPSTMFLSEKTTFNFDNGSSYSPKNVGNLYANKDITMASAIAYSDNIYAVKTHLFLGESELVNMLKKAGFTTNVEPTPSLPLGSYEVNMIEMASAYSSLANGGKKVIPHFINKVEDAYGNVLYTFEEEEEYIFDVNINYILSELLALCYSNSIIDYTYPTCINMASTFTNKYAVKSGSTDSDAWVIGYNPDVVLVSWSGYDDSSDIDNKVVTSNKDYFAKTIESYFKDKETIWYQTPENISGLLINPINGKIATTSSKNKVILYYLKGTEPTLYDSATNPDGFNEIAGLNE